MPTTTWRAARREIMREIGLVQATTTSNIGSGTTIVSTELQSRFHNDDVFNDRWYATVILDDDGGTPANGLGTTTRRVTDYTSSSGTLTTTGPNWSAEDEAVEADLYYLFHPADIVRAYNRARQDIYRDGVGIVRHLHRVTGQRQFTYTVPTTMREIRKVYIEKRDLADRNSYNLLQNPGFESWTSTTAVSNWTLAGSGSSVNQTSETSAPRNYAVLADNESARIEAAVDTATTLLQTFNVSASGYTAVATRFLEGNFSIWVYATVASRISARITPNGGSSTDSTAHGGTGWELLTVSANLGDVTVVSVGITISSGALVGCYVDEATFTIGQSEILDREWDEILAWRHTPEVDGGSNHGLLQVMNPLPEKRRLRILGLDQLSAVTVDASTIEVDGDSLEPVYNYTRYLLAREYGVQHHDDEWQGRANEFLSAYMRDISNGRGHILSTAKVPRPGVVW